MQIDWDWLLYYSPQTEHDSTAINYGNRKLLEQQFSSFFSCLVEDDLTTNNEITVYGTVFISTMQLLEHMSLFSGGS